MPLPDAQPEWARRMEAKLDRLLMALADEGQEDDPGHDLEGYPLPAMRDQNEPL